MINFVMAIYNDPERAFVLAIFGSAVIVLLWKLIPWWIRSLVKIAPMGLIALRVYLLVSLGWAVMPESTQKFVWYLIAFLYALLSGYAIYIVVNDYRRRTDPRPSLVRRAGLLVMRAANIRRRPSRRTA